MTFFDRLKSLLRSPQSSPSHAHDEEEDSATCKDVSCMEALARVHEYLDGELDGISHEEVTRHFSICRKCYPHLRLEERFRELLLRSQRVDVCPEGLKAQVLELLAAEGGEQR